MTALSWRTVAFVVVVLSAACAVAVVMVNGVTARSQRTVCVTDARTVRTAVATDRAEHGSNDSPTMETLVARGYLVSPSAYHSISYSGPTLVLHDVGRCAGVSGT